MRFVVVVLRQAGAVWTVPSPASNVAREMWGPNGEVAEYKLRSNDRWVLSPEECRVLGSRLGDWLRSGAHRVTLATAASAFFSAPPALASAGEA